ncbi:MAG: PAS domain-containing sensor histidine kinase [Candidatus Lokiarchaeota archaeon]|nr:PAS domain-containing sensor histidine kinase [Candidatus Lokiarchaeota archaeon]
MKHITDDKIKEILYDNLMKNYPDFVLILDLEGKIIEVSDNFFLLFGEADTKSFIGKFLIDYIVGEDKNAFLKQLSKIRENKFLKMEEFKFLKKNGAIFIGELSLSIIQGEEGSLDILLGIMRDITDQKTIEKNLKESKRMFQLVMDNIPQLISWKDINSIYLGCNQNFARVAGLDDPAIIIGKSDYELPWKISESESFYEIDQLVMDTDKSEYHIIEPQLQADGKQAWLDTNKIPLHSSKGDVVGILCTYEDISKRIEAETALKHSEKNYREAYNRAEFYKDVFAHDVSNILQGILSSVELCRMRENDQSELEKLYDIIENQVTRGANLVSNIRKISSIDDRERNLFPLNTCDVIRKAVKEVRKNYPKRNFNFQLNSPSEDIFVKANDLLLDVFQNVIYNAVKHNKSKIAEIDVVVNKKEKNGKPIIQIQFVDNGLGIPDSQKTTIFQRGTVESKSSNRLGLGLSLVKKLIEKYDGQIWVEDKIKGNHSKGSNFVILIDESID